MTHKLIFIGYLIVNMSLMGMDPEQYKISKADIEIGSKALTMVVKQRKQVSKRLDLFHQFNSYAIPYFFQDVTLLYKKGVIRDIREKILPKMIVYTEEDKKLEPSYYILKKILDKSNDFIVEDTRASECLFAAIYSLYLNKYPNEACSVLTDHYLKNDTLIGNESYRFFMRTVVFSLKLYVEKKLTYYPQKKDLDYKKLSNDISQVSSYLKNFEMKEFLPFSNIKQKIEHICKELDGAEVMPTTITINQGTPEEESPQDLPKIPEEQVSSASPVQTPTTLTFVEWPLKNQGEGRMPKFLQKRRTRKQGESATTSDQPNPVTSVSSQESVTQPEPAAQQENFFWWFDRKIREGFLGAIESIANWWKNLFAMP